LSSRPEPDPPGDGDAGLGAYRRDPPDAQPVLDWPDYVSTRLRSPRRPLIEIPQTISELTGPAFGSDRIGELDGDLTRQHDGDPQGQRIIVYGRVLDGDGRAIPQTLVEVWQANAAGRYRHASDQHPSPLDPNFTGIGRCLTDAEGRFEFITIRPGAYPWQNHPNAWRPAHIHFSLFGRAFAQRLVTQMYFPGDPLFALDPVFNSVRDPAARERMVSRFSIERTIPEWALAFEYDLVLRGRDETPFEDPSR
jgi:protocatechuate 3,4-dioxygenase beta subunit